MTMLNPKEEPERVSTLTPGQTSVERMLIDQIAKLSLQDFGLNSRVKRTLVRR